MNRSPVKRTVNRPELEPGDQNAYLQYGPVFDGRQSMKILLLTIGSRGDLQP